MRTPARQVVELLLRSGRAVTAEAVSTLGGIDLRPARAWLKHLEKLGVLHADALGAFVAGPAAPLWMAADPRTRPGGRSKSYNLGKQRRELARMLEPHKKLRNHSSGHHAHDITTPMTRADTMGRS